MSVTNVEDKGLRKRQELWGILGVSRLAHFFYNYRA